MKYFALILLIVVILFVKELKKEQDPAPNYEPEPHWIDEWEDGKG